MKCAISVQGEKRKASLFEGVEWSNRENHGGPTILIQGHVDSTQWVMQASVSSYTALLSPRPDDSDNMDLKLGEDSFRDLSWRTQACAEAVLEMLLETEEFWVTVMSTVFRYWHPAVHTNYTLMQVLQCNAVSLATKNTT